MRAVTEISGTRDRIDRSGVSLVNGDVLHVDPLRRRNLEIFDRRFLPNVRNPMMVGLRTPEIRDLITFESKRPA
jgi:hypothetical protein